MLKTGEGIKRQPPWRGAGERKIQNQLFNFLIILTYPNGLIRNIDFIQFSKNVNLIKGSTEI